MIAKMVYGGLLGSFFILLGLFIWRKGSVSFLAGYAKDKVNNEKLLAKRIGLVIILFGFETIILIAVSLYVMPVDALLYGILTGLHVLAILFLMVVTQMSKPE
ncbi:hypothetical protein J7E38_16255 [Bacillus sp. ISL-35]|uniref:hypothetical protein n=1 Tax=Bacillus sp. ISL-35 TaxID=2819122 RepID=UPI001BEBAD3C|nr:hypothetical protein [Bacillus sp. ISL-35]MBT2680562.1 hypothetical protein [Bacillus sp. ISL-35]MBT2704143.1 hypothetical protein [Chryseobacterium sp. ISL-80]